MCTKLRRSVFFPALYFLFSGLLSGAEVRLRKSLLEGLRDRATATITAEIDHIGDHAHSLASDCDLHVPLRSEDIRVPLLGELKNACSILPDGPGASSWTERILDEANGGELTVVGVFRLWLEHPPAGNVIQSESKPLPAYTNSNPKHVVELHPIIQIGSLDFLGHLKLIEDDEEFYKGYGAAQLKTKILPKKLTVQRRQLQGEPYVCIRGPQTHYNHWTLRARIVGNPVAIADGTQRLVDILNNTGTNVVPGALGLPVVAVEGSSAEAKLRDSNAGEIVRFHAVIRMHLPSILDSAETTAKTIALPVEFVLLDFD